MPHRRLKQELVRVCCFVFAAWCGLVMTVPFTYTLHPAVTQDVRIRAPELLRLPWETAMHSLLLLLRQSLQRRCRICTAA
jgi:hypothetical protein